jgi:hypothetical protein
VYFLNSLSSCFLILSSLLIIFFKHTFCHLLFLFKSLSLLLSPLCFLISAIVNRLRNNQRNEVEPIFRMNTLQMLKHFAASEWYCACFGLSAINVPTTELSRHKRRKINLYGSFW